MLLHELVETSRQVAATSSRLAKIELLAELLKRAAPEEIETAIAFLSGSVRQAKVGVGYATLQAARPDCAADAPTLTLADVEAMLERLPGVAGKGSGKAKEQLLRELLARATRDE